MSVCERPGGWDGGGCVCGGRGGGGGGLIIRRLKTSRSGVAIKRLIKKCEKY